MENTPPTSSKPAIQFGTLFGFLMIFLFVILYVTGWYHPENKTIHLIIALLNYFILPGTFIYLACNTYKKNNQGYITVGESVKIGLFTTLTGAVIISLFSSLFIVLNPEYTEQMFAITRETMIEQNPKMSLSEIDKTLEISKKFTNPFITIPITVILFAILGTIFSLVIGAIIKKEKKTF